MSSLYKMFETNESVEQDGILLNYGEARFLIARAGGGNKEFAKVFRDKSKPFRYAIEHSKLSDEDSQQLMAEVYAETVVLGWESIAKDDKGKPAKDAKGNPKLQKKIEGKDGKLIPFSVENCTQLLMDLPELFRDIQAMAARAENFQKEEDEEDAGNLSES